MTASSPSGSVSSDRTSRPELMAFPSLCSLFQDTATRYANSTAVRTLDGSTSLTWAQYAQRVETIARGLAAVGITHGDTVGYLMSNRPEFFPADLAAMHLGAACLSVYQTLPAGDIAWAIEDSGTRLLFTDNANMPLAVEAANNCPGVILVTVDDETPAVMSVQALIDGGSKDFDFTSAWRSVTEDDVALLVYTSGTTSNPKCVELTHRGLLGNALGLHEAVGTMIGARVVSAYPYAHLAERMLSHYRAIAGAFEVVCAPSPREIVETVQRVHPHYVFSPPRLYEKLRGVAITLLEQGLTNSEVLARFGFDEVLVAIAGGAPISPELVQFWIDLGLPLVEGWGQTEGGALGALGRPGANKVGTCGPALPGVELKLAEDDEILMRSPYTMKGYRNQPRLTAEAVDADGWLHTGDIGSIDGDGHLTIVDRKKEILINSGGKNMSPSRIEAKIAQAHPLVGVACVVGNSRPYNVAVISVDGDVAAQLMAQGKTETDLEAVLAGAVTKANTELARVEQIKRFTVVHSPWLPGGDEVTPTMKLRRRVIEEKYGADIELLYVGGGVAPA